MKIIDVGTDSERVVCRVRIEGEYMGEKFVYEDPEGYEGSQYIWTEDNDPSTYWWSEGNMACDCNRFRFLPEHLQRIASDDCGHEIKFFSITPLEGDNLPVLKFDE